MLYFYDGIVLASMRSQAAEMHIAMQSIAQPKGSAHVAVLGNVEIQPRARREEIS